MAQIATGGCALLHHMAIVTDRLQRLIGDGGDRLEPLRIGGSIFVERVAHETGIPRLFHHLEVGLMGVIDVTAIMALLPPALTLLWLFLNISLHSAAH